MINILEQQIAVKKELSIPQPGGKAGTDGSRKGGDALPIRSTGPVENRDRLCGKKALTWME